MCHDDTKYENHGGTEKGVATMKAERLGVEAGRCFLMGFGVEGSKVPVSPDICISRAPVCSQE